MKKKIFAALASVMMLGTALAVPVSAAEPEYQMGDVNLDGVVDIADAQLVLMDYVEVMIGKEGILTNGQRLAGNVDGIISISRISGSEMIADIIDSQYIRIFYCAHLVNSSIRLEDVINVSEDAIDAFYQYTEKYKIVYDETTGKYIDVEKG